MNNTRKDNKAKTKLCNKSLFTKHILKSLTMQDT